MKAMDVLLDADDLARFANLDTDKEAASFQRLTTGRDTGPDFAPATWWKYQATNSAEKQWRFAQKLVRAAWDQQFQSEVGLFDLARLLLSVFDPEDLLENVIPLRSNPYRPPYADVGALAEEYGFHKAIRYLTGGPSWRMKKCKNENCGRRFVADHNERKCCSTECSSGYQLDRQNEWGRKNNWGRPVKAKTAKSSPRLPGSKRKKTAAKT
jgi:hypothetical protein